MSTFILVLDSDKGLPYWAVRNQNSNLDALRLHPFYDPLKVTSHPKQTGDQNEGTVNAIAVTGGSTPATIILLESTPPAMEAIATAMNSHFATVQAGPTKKTPKAASKGKKVTKGVSKKSAKPSKKTKKSK